MGCDTKDYIDKIVSDLFQSTHPRGVRPTRGTYAGHPAYFNPRTHVGCDREHDDNRQFIGISIHAPTWGATLLKILGSSTRQFQSTHPRGVRLTEISITFAMSTFQSTHPRGVRRLLTIRDNWVVVISIHAPTWGATYFRYWSHNALLISIHAPTWGATGCVDQNQKTKQFQSTHPRGVRPNAVDSNYL